MTRKKSPTFLQNPQRWESVHGEVGGWGSLWSNNEGRKRSFYSSDCTGPKVQPPHHKRLRLMKAISSWSNFMSEEQRSNTEAGERARRASSAGL